MSEQGVMFKAREWTAGASVKTVAVAVPPAQIHAWAAEIAAKCPHKLCVLTLTVKVDAVALVDATPTDNGDTP